MSAYGAIARSRPDNALAPTIWSTEATVLDEQTRPQEVNYVSLHHFTLETARKYEGLVEYLRSVFAGVVDEGRTYPQEGIITTNSFETYFLAADLILGLALPKFQATLDGTLFQSQEHALESASKNWEASIAGFYYVKPNYPGRSSHICNGGFVVPPTMRGKGYGRALAKSYLHYAPKLGYQASVFNLVYVNNVASIKLWEALGFKKAGLIPFAGRLKKKDGDGEELVDAHVFYKKFQE